MLDIVSGSEGTDFNLFNPGAEKYLLFCSVQIEYVKLLSEMKSQFLSQLFISLSSPRKLYGVSIGYHHG